MKTNNDKNTEFLRIYTLSKDVPEFDPTTRPGESESIKKKNQL